MVVLDAMAPSSEGEKHILKQMKTMVKDLQADSGPCLPHWLERPRTNRLQLLLFCGIGKRFADRSNQQRQVGERTGLSERKPRAWCFEALEESLYASADSGILREQWTSCSFPCSSVWAEDAAYGIGRVDWKKLLWRQQKWEWCRTGCDVKSCEPDGVPDTQRAPQAQEQPETPQVCCSGEGDDHEPLRGSSNPVDGKKILQALGPEIGAIGATENGSSVDSVSDENSCFAVSCHDVLHADMCCNGCCLADVISCFGIPVQECVEFQAADAWQSGGPRVEVDSESKFHGSCWVA